jgi:hypothetical protein
MIIICVGSKIVNVTVRFYNQPSASARTPTGSPEEKEKPTGLGELAGLKGRSPPGIRVERRAAARIGSSEALFLMSGGAINRL